MGMMVEEDEPAGPRLPRQLRGGAPGAVSPSPVPLVLLRREVRIDDQDADPLRSGAERGVRGSVSGLVVRRVEKGASVPIDAVARRALGMVERNGSDGQIV